MYVVENNPCTLKRSRSTDMESLTYETAIKKAQLVDRNPSELQLNPLRASQHDKQDIISLAAQIQNADKMLKSTTSQKLCVILDQIKMLQAQAVNILKESEENNKLHNAACNFVKRPGSVYHLYQKESGEHYFSMLSPEEWNNSTNQKFLGSYRLETDYTWTPLHKVAEQDEKRKWAERLMQSSSTNISHLPFAAIDFSNTVSNVESP